MKLAAAAKPPKAVNTPPTEARVMAISFPLPLISSDNLLAANTIPIAPNAIPSIAVNANTPFDTVVESLLARKAIPMIPPIIPKVEDSPMRMLFPFSLTKSPRNLDAATIPIEATVRIIISLKPAIAPVPFIALEAIPVIPIIAVRVKRVPPKTTRPFIIILEVSPLDIIAPKPAHAATRPMDVSVRRVMDFIPSNAPTSFSTLDVKPTVPTRAVMVTKVAPKVPSPARITSLPPPLATAAPSPAQATVKSIAPFARDVIGLIATFALLRLDMTFSSILCLEVLIKTDINNGIVTEIPATPTRDNGEITDILAVSLIMPSTLPTPFFNSSIALKSMLLEVFDTSLTALETSTITDLKFFTVLPDNPATFLTDDGSPDSEVTRADILELSIFIVSPAADGDGVEDSPLDNFETESLSVFWGAR